MKEKIISDSLHEDQRVQQETKNLQLLFILIFVLVYYFLLRQLVAWLCVSFLVLFVPFSGRLVVLFVSFYFVPFPS